MTIPPVNSTPRCRPRVARKNTASRKVIPEITLNTNACRMKGMSFWMRKNSMSCSLDGARTSGGLSRPLVPVDVADRQPCQLAARAEHEVHDRARHSDGAEHRRQDAQTVHHGEAAHRARPEQEQGHARA